MSTTDGIQLRHPLPGDLIGRTLLITAVGTAFEASYGWRLTSDGTVIAQGFFQAGSMGLVEAFSHAEDVDHGHLGPATLELFGDDPTGEHQPGADLVTVPVILVPGVRGYLVHQVVRGDTLSALARTYGSTVAHIAVASSLPDPDLIRVGQVLRIPA